MGNWDLIVVLTMGEKVKIMYREILGFRVLFYCREIAGSGNN